MTLRLFLLLLVSALAAGCSKKDRTLASFEVSTAPSASIDELKKRYPLGMIDVKSVVWVRNTYKIPAYEVPPPLDANPNIRAVLELEDKALIKRLSAGRAVTVDDMYDWYPAELTALGEGPHTILVSRSVEGLPGIVMVYKDAPTYAVVAFDEFQHR